MTGRRRALLVATERYLDPTIAQLRAPSRDVAELARVLQDPAIGDFEVATLLDRPTYEVLEAIEDFFDAESRDDLRLLYFSGHGVKDQTGRLFFGMANTQLNRLRATGVPAAFINDLMRDSRARCKLLILDCCYAGAFARGMTARGGQAVGLSDCFHDGRGHVVLTASDSMQYAFEGDHLSGEAEPSVFTKVLVDGLASGEADVDHDGQVSVDDLYEYMHREVTARVATQRPQKWVFGVEGAMHLARNPRPQASLLPEHLAALLVDSRSLVRRAAIELLAELLADPRPGLVLAASDALVAMLGDDSLEVSRAARRVLDATGAPAAAGAPAQVAALAQPSGESSSSVSTATAAKDSRPSWAVAAGEDKFGRWADFEVGEVRARLRWIERGEFLMGSPDTEMGRSADELQHTVTLTHGYWLAEVPVTQALWKAVMGNNPSCFVSDDRPVENVTLGDVTSS